MASGNWYSGTGGSWYGTSSSFAAPKKKKHSLLGKIVHVPLDFTDHLANDIKNAVVGLPTGLVTLAEHPVRGLVDMGKTTWHDWSPYFAGGVHAYMGVGKALTGNFGGAGKEFGRAAADEKKFIKQVYAHPLAPILDVATVLTGGIGGAAKVTNLITHAEYKAAISVAEKSAFERGLARGGTEGMSRAQVVAHGGGLARADINANLSRLGKWGRPQERFVSGRGTEKGVGDIAVSLPKPLHRNPLIRARQNAAANLGHQLSSALPGWFGAGAKIRDLSEAGEFGRLAAKQASTARAAHNAAVAAQMQIVKMVQTGKLAKDDPRALATTMHAHSRPQLEDHSIAADPAKIQIKQKRKMKRWAKEQQGLVPASHATRQVEHASEMKFGVTLPQKGAVDLTKANKGHLPEKFDYEEHYIAPKGWQIVKADRGIPDSVKLETPQDLENFVQKKFGALNASKTVRKGDEFRDAEGNLRLVREDVQRAYNEEAFNSIRFMNVLFAKPTQIWKGLVLKYSPRYFVNNAVGNMFMFLMMSNPRSVAALAGAYKDLHGDRAATAALKRAESSYRRQIGPEGTAINHWYGETYKHGQAREYLLENQATRTGRVRSSKAYKVASQGLLPGTHQVAERFLRLASTRGLLMAQPEIRALMRQGHKFDEAVNMMSGDISFRYRINEAVNDVLGDYHHLTPIETRVRAFVPFYTWTRAISRHTTKLALNYPARAGFLAKEGQMGVEKTKEILGEIPDFLRGSVPMELLGFHHSPNTRAGILTTQGLNPYATVQDAVNAIQALTAGNVPTAEAAASQLGPIPTGAIEYLTGTSLLTGAAKKHHGGLISSIVYEQGLQTPIPRLIERAMYGAPKTKTGKPTLYKKDFAQELRAVLGVPIKEMDPTAAATLYRRERGIKKGRASSNDWYSSQATSWASPWIKTTL